jgi:3-dehydroquinate dehydratase/shikimate dehydrogenase
LVVVLRTLTEEAESPYARANPTTTTSLFTVAVQRLFYFMGNLPPVALCAVITAGTTAELRARRDAASPAADLLELRLDTVRDPDVDAALAGRTKPVIATCRARWEGGHFEGSEEERLGLLEKAWQQGAEFVDLEFAARDRAPWAASGARVILSHHDFGGVPADLAGRHRAMAASGAAVVKLAVTPSRLSDCARLLALTVSAPQRQVVLAMGAAGLPTRLLPARFGSAWSYAGDEVAPGQVSLARMRDEYRFGEVSADAELYGLVARPVGHSVSPAMHNAAHRARRRDAIYIPLQAEDVDDLLAFASAFDLRGASVTVPFKVDVVEHCTPTARATRAGAVNTLIRREGGWAGDNTDMEGLLAPLEGLRLPSMRVVVLGAGGAARAAAAALVDAGARVTVCARRSERAAEVAALAGCASAAMPPPPGSWDLLVNATSAGMYPNVDDTPWPNARFDGALVYDLVYNPRETRLLREADEAGCETLGGLPMLVAQAEQQFALWTGTPPPLGAMQRAAQARLRDFRRPQVDTRQGS